MNSLYYLPLSLGWTASRPDQMGHVFRLTTTRICSSRRWPRARTNFQSVASSNRGGRQLHDHQCRFDPRAKFARRLVGGSERQRPMGQRAAHQQRTIRARRHVAACAAIRKAKPTATPAGARCSICARRRSMSAIFRPQNGDVPANLRASVFMDYGQVFHLDRPLAAIRQWGTGIGFYLTAGEHFDARLTLAWALQIATPDELHGRRMPGLFQRRASSFETL